MADVNMRILTSVVGQQGVLSAINGIANAFGNGSGGLQNVLGSLGSAFGNVKFALQNIGTEGTLTRDALVAAGSDMGDAALGVASAAAAASVAVGALGVGIGVVSTKMAGDYQQSLNMVQALTGSNTQQMQQYDASLKQLATDAGVAPTQLATGLYNVLSAGYAGQQAMNVLTLSTEDAKIGMTDASTTTSALTNVLRSFSVQAQNVTSVNGEMLETVTLGKATFAQYASNITDAASSSVQFGVSMETMNAAWATMTSSGISAAQATTDYSQSLSVMYGNIGVVTDSLQKNGIAFDETKFNAASYGDKILMLNQALQQASAQHVHITGVTKQAEQAIGAISQHIGTYNSDLATLSDKQAMADKTQQAWGITQGGFNQTMDRLNATVQTLAISVGQQLLPPITNLIGQLTPAITHFATWATQSHILENTIKNITPFFQQIASTVQTMLPPVLGLFMRFVGLLRQLGEWVQHNQLALQAFKDIAIALGAILVGVIAVGLILVTVGIATLALAIGILVGIIMGVTWVIQHWPEIWGAVVGFVQGIWKGFTDWLGNSLHFLGQLFQATWDGIRNGVGNFFSALGSFVHNALTALWNAFLKPFQDIGQLFVWLYQHNRYFQMLIDGIRMIISAGLAWLQMAWNTVINWLVNLWRTVSGFATQAWNAVLAAITVVVMAVVTWLMAQWTNITNWLSTQWGKFSGMMSDAWKAVSGVISSAWQTYIAGPIGDVWNKFSGWATDLKNQFLTWGQNFIENLIQGIKNKVGDLINQAKDVAGQLANYLGFHSPAKLGPGADADKWMPNLLSMMNAGLVSGQAQLQTTLNTVLTPPVALNQLPASASSYYNNTTNGGNTFVINLSTMARSQSEVRNLVDMMEAEIGRRVRVQTSGYASGGVW